MDLTERHKRILNALVDEFIQENRPVGSKTLFDKHDIGLSPASIRTVLKDLEDFGYLASKHTSAGRIPTERAYRFYVDSLVILYELTLKEKQRIQQEYLKMQFKLDQILKATASVLSSLSNAAGIVIGPAKNFRYSETYRTHPRSWRRNSNDTCHEIGNRITQKYFRGSKLFSGSALSGF